MKKKKTASKASPAPPLDSANWVSQSTAQQTSTPTAQAGLYSASPGGN